MKGERGKLYDNAEDFFELQGSVVMRLTSNAAIEACCAAAERGLVVARIEGGIWLHPGFEARRDCIWDGADPPLSYADASANNEKAAGFIADKSSSHDVFILTAPPMTGWPHKIKAGEN